MSPCNAPLSEEELTAYWLGELAGEVEQRAEEHLLGCAQCSARLEELTALAGGIASAFRRGFLRAAISRPLLDRMKQQGLRLREYRVMPGGSVHCSISADDDLAVGRLQATLDRVSRLDFVYLEHGEERFRLRDIPFDAAAGEVLFCPTAVELKKKPAHTGLVRLIAVDEVGERPIGEYTFIHTPG